MTLAGNGTAINFTYDASDSNTAIEQGVNKVTYVKTASGSVLRKKEYTSGTLTKSYRYLAGGAAMQSCSLTDDNSCTATDTYLSLPGGVTLTLSPTNPDTTKRTAYSIKNFHGDTAITANELGLPTSSVYLYEPFGQPSSSTTFSTNSSPTNATDQSMGWAASPTRKVASSSFSLPIIQMGARVYLPTAGRFLQVDPVEGGTANAYVYAHDPVNANDYSGQCIGPLALICAAVVAIPAVIRAAPAAIRGVQSAASGVTRLLTRSAPATQKISSVVNSPAVQRIGIRSAPLMDRKVVDTLGNTATNIGGRVYSGHALNQKQNSGIYPSVVENTVKWGQKLQSSQADTTKLYESTNNMTVILNEGGNVVTTWFGR